MKLSKLVLIAALAACGLGQAQAAPDTAKIAAKLQASAVSTDAIVIPAGLSKQQLKKAFNKLPESQQEYLIAQFKALPPEVRSELKQEFKDLPTSPGG